MTNLHSEISNEQIWHLLELKVKEYLNNFKEYDTFKLIKAIADLVEFAKIYTSEKKKLLLWLSFCVNWSLVESVMAAGDLLSSQVSMLTTMINNLNIIYGDEEWMEMISKNHLIAQFYLGSNESIKHYAVIVS